LSVLLRCRRGEINRFDAVSILVKMKKTMAAEKNERRKIKGKWN